ncbi:MAG: glucan biosynthesis protein D [Gallionellaceae bacterium]|jgi:glucans biosynthesis protein|nr:glucan biosynthesis protein D [Gallionellaceae bacterium]
MLNRRRFLSASAAAVASLMLPEWAGAFAAEEDKGGNAAASQTGLRFAEAQPFSLANLLAQARDLAGKPYVSPTLPSDILDKIDYEEHGKIHFKSEDALYTDGAGQFPLTFFHLGRYFQTPVQMYALNADGNQAREIIYDPEYFDMPADSPARRLPQGAGFAGFRFQESRLGDQDKLPWQKNDWVAFLGASYFRAIGELYQYGLSARGIAVNVAEAGRAEEFPAFTQFYFAQPKAGSDFVTVYALLDGPSVTGAYCFVMQRGKAVVMEVSGTVFLRKDVARLGIAPLTSMYWFSETAKQTAIDWRPEVHDSDGLAIWNGNGEHLWRPLVNPAQTTASAFSDKNPHGFGLRQRDRLFDHYEDGVYYERRPSLWVEPLGDWGEGSVQLIEIPTDDEINDNIVAMWVPQQPALAGAEYHFSYRLHWLADEPYPPALARCVATRIGRGGEPGKPRPQGVHKFVVEFLGGALEKLPFGVRPEAILGASRGSFANVFCEAVPDGVAGHWRAQFDLVSDGAEPVELRLYLKNGDAVLSETWLYQYHPLAND